MQEQRPTPWITGRPLSDPRSTLLAANEAQSPPTPASPKSHNAVKAGRSANRTRAGRRAQKGRQLQKNKVDLHGQRISIETPKGAERRGTDEGTTTARGQ